MANRCASADRSENRVVRHVVKETLDIKIDHPLGAASNGCLHDSTASNYADRPGR